MVLPLKPLSINEHIIQSPLAWLQKDLQSKQDLIMLKIFHKLYATNKNYIGCFVNWSLPLQLFHFTYYRFTM